MTPAAEYWDYAISCLRRPGALFEKTAPGPHKNFLLNGSFYSEFLQNRNPSKYNKP